jgi:hypothetical protein
VRRAGGVALILLAVIVAVAVIIGGYQLGWWLEKDSVNRRARINQDSYNRQNALVEQVLDDISEAQDPNLPAAQRAAIVDQVCDSAAKLTGSIELPLSAQNFINQECQ